MPPFFFDFFFLAFVGLFTRLHIHNGVCLRILLFFWKPIFPTVLVETGPIQCRAMKSLAGSFFLRIFPCCTFFHRSNDESPETILPIIQPFFFLGESIAVHFVGSLRAPQLFSGIEPLNGFCSANNSCLERGMKTLQARRIRNRTRFVQDPIFSSARMSPLEWCGMRRIRLQFLSSANR